MDVRNCMELCVLLVTLTAMVSASPVAVQEEEEVVRVKRSHRAGQHHGSVNRQQLNFLCPWARCSEIDSECSNVEYIVFEYSFYNNRGHRVDLRCESCTYCLDPPKRRKRSIFEPVTARGCPVSLRCPDIPDSCSNVKMANVLVQDEYCRKCPACFDGTMLV